MPPNVLLVVLDSVRARNSSLTGHVRETMPFLAEFADRATVYEQARSAGARSITGHASLFTGRPVEEHGLTTADRQLQPNTTVFERLQDEGYATGVFSENVWITTLEIGLQRGFDTVVGPQDIPFPSALNPRRFVADEGVGQYREFLRACLSDDRTGRSLANGIATKLAADYPRLYPFDGSAPGGVYLDRFLDWEATQDGPWAACLNLMDGHRPYEPADEHNIWGTDMLRSVQDRRPNLWELLTEPSKYWMLSATESLYDGAIHQLDAVLSDLVESLERRGVLDETLLVVTSDHGDGMGEPSRVRPDVRVAGHNTALHETVLHVPLVVKFPGQQEGQRRSQLAALTQFPDAVESALDGTAGPAEFCVERALASSYGILADQQLRSRAERFQSEDALKGFTEPLRAVYTDGDGVVRKQLAWGDRNAVRVTVRDAQTSYVEGSVDPAVVNEQFEALDTDALVSASDEMAEVDPATEQRLEDLGYI